MAHNNLLIDQTAPEGRWKNLGLVIVHFVASVSLSIVIGFYPESKLAVLYSDSSLATLTPVMLLIAGLLGFLSARFIGHRAVTKTWIVGLVWLSLGFLTLASEWNPAWDPKSRSHYVLGQLFGSGCGSSECIEELIFTTPFLCSIAYSVGGRISNFSVTTDS